MGRPRRRRGGRLPRAGGGATGPGGAAARRARPAARVCTRRAGNHLRLAPPGGDVGGGGTRRARRRRHRHRVGQVARLQPAGAQRDRSRPEDARPLPLSDEGARTGSGPRARGAEAEGAAPRDLRRRHGGRAAVARPPLRQRGLDEPGHAPCRRPAAPRPLGRRPPQPPLRRGGRGARLPRGLRVTRRQCSPPPPPTRPRVRRRATVPARVGHDREPGRARPRAHG